MSVIQMIRFALTVIIFYVFPCTHFLIYLLIIKKTSCHQWRWNIIKIVAAVNFMIYFIQTKSVCFLIFVVFRTVLECRMFLLSLFSCGDCGQGVKISSLFRSWSCNFHSKTDPFSSTLFGHIFLEKVCRTNYF
jgi:hypothetical protein